MTEGGVQNASDGIVSAVFLLLSTDGIASCGIENVLFSASDPERSEFPTRTVSATELRMFEGIGLPGCIADVSDGDRYTSLLAKEASISSVTGMPVSASVMAVRLGVFVGVPGFGVAIVELCDSEDGVVLAAMPDGLGCATTLAIESEERIHAGSDIASGVRITIEFRGGGGGGGEMTFDTYCTARVVPLAMLLPTEDATLPSVEMKLENMLSGA
jgi:hypothetical protein